MTASTNAGDNVIPIRALITVMARRPDHLDLAVMQRRHGRVLGTVWVWRNRALARRELQRLALWEPDSVLEDAGISREAAEREARRWFWQDFLP